MARRYPSISSKELLLAFQPPDVADFITLLSHQRYFAPAVSGNHQLAKVLPGYALHAARICILMCSAVGWAPGYLVSQSDGGLV